MRVVGLMSGTSLDGIDAAIADLTLDGECVRLHPLGSVRALYDDDLREAIAAALPPAPTTIEAVCRLDTRIGQAFAEVAVAAIEHIGPVDLIVSHGQTLFHWVEEDRVAGTLQLGQPAWIAERTRVPVISDLRARDVAAGGQGAPLVSLLDVLLVQGRPGIPAALNLGGIANLTVVADHPVAFDTGPGNALLDAAARLLLDAPHDEEGAAAARGTVIPELLDRLLSDPYYARPAPKTTGKERFNRAYLGDLTAHAADDVLATLTALTARTVTDAAHAHGVTELIVSGGGVSNATLMAAIARELPTLASDELGLPAQDKEAYAFALLGFLTIHGLPGTIARCTGATHASILGSITPGLDTGPAPRRLTLG